MCTATKQCHDAPVELFGRDNLLERVGALLDGDARLLTLVGPGGIGKTTLARHITGARSDALFIDLSEARSLEGVASKVAIALEVPLTGAGNDDAIVAGLASGVGAASRLLVLDNCEQATESIARVAARILAEQPRARLLATSREPLGLPEEVVLEVPLLSDDEALALLKTRARAVRPEVSFEDEALARDVVRRLDHLPLAIELAAARLEILDLPQLAHRLDERLKLLKRMGGSGPARHARLRDTIDWSWELLDDDERRALAQCAVFYDGFSLEAAEAVLEVDEWVTDVLHALKRRSLVVTEESRGMIRFRLLESVRAFAAERLAELDPDASARVRFVDYFAPEEPEAERPWRDLDRAGSASLRLELENLLEALRLAREGPEPVRSPLRVTSAALILDRFFAAEGPPAVQLRILDQAVEAANQQPDQLRLARVLLARGEAYRRKARRDDAAADFTRAEEVLEGHDDERLNAELDLRWALQLMVAGDFEASEARAQRVVDRLEAGRTDPRVAGLALGLHGSIHQFFGDARRGEQRLERALPYLREARDDRSIALTLANLGVIRIDRGEHEEGVAKLDEAEKLFLGVHDRFNLATTLVNRALSDLDLGNLERARHYLEQTRELSERVSHHRLVAHATLCLGVAAHLESDLSAARGLLVEAGEAAEESREIGSLGATRAHLAAVYARLGEIDVAEEQLEAARSIAARFPGPWVDRVTRAMAILVEGTGDLDDIEDEPVHVRLAKHVVRSSLGDDDRPTLRIGREGEWMELPGEERVDLSRRGPLRRLLVALAKAHDSKTTLSVFDLVDAGWPEEKIQPDAAAGRVYAAVRTMRKLGLEPFLLTRDEGYLFDPDSRVVLEES
jgi:predicted ATPase